MSRGSFGSSQRSHSATQLRFIVALLSGSVVALLAMLVSVLHSGNATPRESIAYAAPVPQLTELLVARMRIESGMELSEHLFETKAVLHSELPPGALLKKDLQRLNGTYATQLIPLGSPLYAEYITQQPPMRLQDIPAGFRAVTIALDSRERVGDHVKPFSRVDVNCVYVDKDGTKKLGTIVNFAKVFSVGGCIRPEDCREATGQGVSTVTLIVTDRDARKIELARSLGSLSLSLVGDATTGERDSEIMTPQKLFNTSEPEEEVKVSGCIDFPTGNRRVRKCLTEKGWVEADSLKGRSHSEADQLG